jgi:hypothetical protein
VKVAPGGSVGGAAGAGGAGVWVLVCINVIRKVRSAGYTNQFDGVTEIVAANSRRMTLLAASKLFHHVVRVGRLPPTRKVQLCCRRVGVSVSVEALGAFNRAQVVR